MGGVCGDGEVVFELDVVGVGGGGCVVCVISFEGVGLELDLDSGVISCGVVGEGAGEGEGDLLAGVFGDGVVESVWEGGV